MKCMATVPCLLKPGLPLKIGMLTVCAEMISLSCLFGLPTTTTSLVRGVGDVGVDVDANNEQWM